MTRYTAAHLATAHRLDLHLGTKQTERIAQALCDHERAGHLSGRLSMSTDIEDALRQTMAFALGDRGTGWLATE